MYGGAILSLAILVSVLLLYPVLYSEVHLNFGLVHVNLLGGLLVAFAPLMLLYIWWQRRSIRLHWLDLFLILTLAFIFIRGVIAASRLGGGVGMILYFVAYVLLFYYIGAILGQKYRGVLTLSWLLAGIIIVIALYALLEFALKKNILYGGMLLYIPADKSYYRATSTIGQPVWLGLLLVQLAPLLILFYFRAKTKLRRVILGGCLVSTALAIEITFSKGAWLTAAILVLAGMWFLKRKTGSFKSASGLLIASALAVAFFTTFYWSDAINGVDSHKRVSESFAPRILMWERAPAVFLDNPLFGVGLSQGPKEIIYRESHIKNFKQPISIDNLYITLFTEQGLIGVFLVGTTLVLIGRGGWKLLLKAKGEHIMFAIAFCAGLFATLIDGLTFNSLLTNPNLIVFWLTAGLLRALLVIEENRETAKKTRNARSGSKSSPQTLNEASNHGKIALFDQETFLAGRGGANV